MDVDKLRRHHVQQVGARVFGLPVPALAHHVAHDFLLGALILARAGLQGCEAARDAAEGLHPSSNAHRGAVRRVAVAVQQRVLALVRVIHSDDQGAHARACVLHRGVHGHGEAHGGDVAQHDCHRHRGGHRGLRRAPHCAHRRVPAALSARLRGDEAHARPGVDEQPGIHDEPDSVALLREPSLPLLLEHPVARCGAPAAAHDERPAD
mmetsp:Transcript_12155/g.39981  ORF Transcript_12155/g.39981 Transcript_12155/m.39981 type:complete len:208 (+) Transcript_12155:148-771(+)